jgi:hypothetical protein
MSPRKTFVCLLAVLATTACRDTEPFVLNRPTWPDSAAVRLTFNPGDDRAPAWNTAGDSILYVADGFAPFPIRPGVVLSLPKDGGDAAAFMEPMQFGVKSQPNLGAAAISAQRIAFLEITRLEQYECAVPVCPNIGVDMDGAHLRLREAALRVRRSDASTGVDEFALPIAFQGAVIDSSQHPFGLPYVHVHTTHPYHRLYNIYRDPFFRPSWSPDGQTVVFSDGLDLYRWQVGTPAATLIPNTRDAVWPAWSPDGQSIAFTRLSRIFAANLTCNCFTPKGDITAVYQTTLYHDPGNLGRLVVMNADGSNQREIGDGMAPAWMPNSRDIVAARRDGIFLIDVATAAASLIPSTAGGAEPAVSPDGSTLAFARVSAGGTYDIWKIRLQ